jgi:O-antigen/teichoic acid export membrane protein
MAIFGPGFQAGAAVVAIGAVAQFFNCAVGSVGYLLLMSGNQLQLVKIQAVNAVLMVVLNVLLVPRFGIKGAALAAALTVVSTNLWSLVVVRRTLKLFPYNTGYFKLALPGLLSSGAVFGLMRVSAGMHSQWRAAGLALVGTYAIFMGMIFAFGLDNEDRLIARMIWGRFSRIYPKNGRGQ